MAQAFEAAECGRPGPVLIDLPKNVQLQTVEWHPDDPTCGRFGSRCGSTATHQAGRNPGRRLR